MLKIYWAFVDVVTYIVLSLFFLLICLGIYFKSMIDRICYNFFSKMDAICEWVAKKILGPRCKCKLKEKVKK